MSTGKVRTMLLSQQPGIGGAERLVLATLARTNRLDVTVVAPSVQCRLAQEMGLRTLPLDLPRVRSPFLGPFRLLARSFQVRKIAKRLGAQVIYANASRAMGYGLFARVLGGPPVLIHNHHLLRSSDVTMMEGGLLSRSRFLKAIQRWADLIVVPSETAAQAFSDRNKVKVLYNGIDIKHFYPPIDKAAAKSALGLHPGAFVIGTVSRADPQKGMGAFLEVAKRLSHRSPPPAFLIVGGASFPHEANFYQQIQKTVSAIAAQVVLTGIMDDPLPALHSMDLMLHTSELPESFGLTVAEAMACGVPVVGFDWGGVSEVIVDGETGILVKPLDLDAMAESSNQLLDDSSIRAEMGRAAIHRCQELFDINDFALRISSLIEGLVRKESA
jgi:glycosyltransferase involved in cell wall biosynthesis